jgi:hypothetical protein
MECQSVSLSVLQQAAFGRRVKKFDRFGKARLAASELSLAMAIAIGLLHRLLVFKKMAWQ